MAETEWMYDSLTERFGEALGDRQKVVDALLIAKSLVGTNPLGGTSPDSLISVARFILDEWGKHSDAEEMDVDDGPVVLDDEVITKADLDLLKYGTYTFPEGSRWTNYFGTTMIFADGDFLLEDTMISASIHPDVFPFTRIKEEN